MKAFLGLILLAQTIPLPSCGPVAAPYDCTAPPAVTGLVKVKDAVPGKYIVVLKPISALGALREGEDIRSFALKIEGAQQVQSFTHFRGFTMISSESVAKQVAKDPAVMFVQEDGRKKINAEEKRTAVVIGHPAATVTWALDRIDQKDLPLDGLYEPDGKGQGVHVYVVDTGVDTGITEFAGRVGEGFSSFGGEPSDGHGHGTHVAGSVLGTKYGVAKAATLHAVRVLDAQGSGTDSDVIRGIDWAAAHCLATGKPCIGNMSLGGSAAPALDLAVCNALSKGLHFAVAAGNDNLSACAYSPSRVKQALTLGASDDRDNSASFSNTGLCVDLYGPGVDVESAAPGGGNATYSGTSMASPHGAGVAALCLGRDATADPFACVLATATPSKITGGTSDTPKSLLYAK